ncbi:MAG: hypothetical protein JKY65_00760 [Planctomycetes bacterium]|nr:hypothetical protein [Planctomycetota bacterium]
MTKVDPLEALRLRLRRGEQALWQGRPGLKLGLGPSVWRRGLFVSSLLLGTIFLASLAPALESQITWAEALRNGAGWVLALTPFMVWIGALWWVRRISGSGGCVVSILAICVPLVVSAWLFQTVSQPKALPELLLHPLFLAGGGASLLCVRTPRRRRLAQRERRRRLAALRA